MKRIGAIPCRVNPLVPQSKRVPHVSILRLGFIACATKVRASN